MGKSFPEKACKSKIKALTLCKSLNAMEKNNEHKRKSVFQRILEDKRAIRQCIQKKEDIKKIAKERGIKFATPL